MFTYSLTHLLTLFFVSGPFAKLSWPSRQLLSARKSTISYRKCCIIIIIIITICLITSSWCDLPDHLSGFIQILRVIVPHSPVCYKFTYLFYFICIRLKHV